MNIRPSSLPALAACPCFESDQNTNVEGKSAGTRRHTALGKYLTDDATWVDEIDEDDRAGVEWAGEYIRVHAPVSEHPLEIEQPGEFLTPEWDTVRGTPDIYCGPVLFDAKGRNVDAYAEQMAAYVLMRSHPVVRVHVLYLTEKRAHAYDLTQEEAAEIVFPIIARAQGHFRFPKPSDWCGWCKHRLACPAIMQGVNAVVDGREDWNLNTYHSSQIETAEEMGKAWRIARLLKPWCAAVEFAAKEMAVKRGIIPTGTVLYTRKGKQVCDSVAQAFPLTGIPQDEFLAACDIRMSTPKGKPDRKGLVERFAEFHGLSKAEAKRQIQNRLANVLTRNPSTQCLKAADTDDPESEE